MPSDEKKRKPNPAVLRRLLGEYRHEVPLLIIAAVIAVAASGAELLPHLFVRDAINYLQRWFGVGPLKIAPFVVLIIVSSLVHNLLQFSIQVSRAELGVRVSNHLRRRMYAAVQRHSLTFHKRTTTGDLIARSTADVQHMAEFIRFGVFGTADMLIFLIGAVGILIALDWRFAAIALSPVPFAALLTFRVGMKVRPLWKQSRDTYGQGTATLQAEEARFDQRTTTFLQKVLAAIEYWVVRMVGPNFVFGLVMPAALAYGGYAAIRGQLGVGDIVFCFSVMHPIERRLHHIMHLVETYQRAAAASERVFEVLDEEPGIRSKPGAKPFPGPVAGDTPAVEFRNVSFGFDPQKPVLHEVSFSVRTGQTVGIVGHTGSGKSTLLSLIPRFHDPAAGSVRIHGMDVRDIQLEELRRAVGIVFQETFLFSDTVRENIAYGNPRADFAAVQAAAQAAQAHEFILGLEKGYDTIIGERGVTLSGGQAQRIAIARAILLDPAVLLLDDATASVDSETERLIRETMRRVAEGRTTFVVSHRVSSVAHADEILVLRGGRIVERGTHAELVELGGTYSRMCDQQFVGKNDAI